MTSDQTYTLPDRLTLRARLLAVDDDPHLQKRFYPLLERRAGRRLNGVGVLNTILFSIYDYAGEMPSAVATVMKVRMDEWINALCPDTVVAEDARAHWNAVQGVSAPSGYGAVE